MWSSLSLTFFWHLDTRTDTQHQSAGISTESDSVVWFPLLSFLQKTLSTFLLFPWFPSRLFREPKGHREIYVISASCSANDRPIDSRCAANRVLTALQLHDAGLDVHREVLQIHGTGQDQCYSADTHMQHQLVRRGLSRAGAELIITRLKMETIQLFKKEKINHFSRCCYPDWYVNSIWKQSFL